jgi:DNA polymerase V
MTKLHEIKIIQSEEGSPIFLRHFPGYVQAGFPSPAADYLEEIIDLEHLLRHNPLSTFIVRNIGDSMIDAHIPPNSLLIVDKSVVPSNNKIVVAVVNGEFLLKYFIKNSSGIRLLPANKKYPPIPITEGMDFSIWGTVTKIILSV